MTDTDIDYSFTKPPFGKGDRVILNEAFTVCLPSYPTNAAGPIVTVEECRQSSDGLLALVTHSGGRQEVVPVSRLRLWKRYVKPDWWEAVQERVHAGGYL